MTHEELIEQKKRLGRLKAAQQRILDDFDFRKAENAYFRTPYFVRMVWEGDKIHGTDDGEPPADYYEAHPEEFYNTNK